MGVLRHSRPRADGFHTDFAVSGGATGLPRWDAVDDEFRSGTNIVRGTGGGVETDPANDDVFVTRDGSTTLLQGFTSFNFLPIAGDDDFSRLDMIWRIRNRGPGSVLIRPYLRRGSTIFPTSTIQSVNGDSVFVERTLEMSRDLASVCSVLRPTAQGNYSAWNRIGTGLTINFQAVDEVVADDTATYLLSTTAATTRDSFTMTPDTAPTQTTTRLFFIIRASHGIDEGGSLRGNAGDTKVITIFYRVGGTDYDIGTVTVESDGLNPLRWRDYLLIRTTNPATSAAWTVADLASPEFGFRSDAGGLMGLSVTQFYAVADGALPGRSWDTADLTASTPWQFGDEPQTPSEFGLNLLSASTNLIDVSRAYLSATFATGPTGGKSLRKENWRRCDVCANKVPYSQIVTPQPPHPQSGLKICSRCFDKPDHDTLMTIRGNRVVDRVDPLY